MKSSSLGYGEKIRKILLQGPRYSGHIGDGKIFIYDVENVVKVRTGEEGYDALQDVEYRNAEDRFCAEKP